MKIAIILFNLGGPDSLEAVQPFLRNLFSDRAIIDLPRWMRLPLARFLAARRAVIARKIYAQIGGSSPILGQSEAQSRALDEALSKDGQHQWRSFVCMRYWHPFTAEVVQEVRRFVPDRVILLPLYPQFSTTTTASSAAEWKREAARLPARTTLVCCHPDEAGFISASAELVRQELAALAVGQKVRVLLSAHGLPEKVVKAGDPYRWQVERTAQAIAAAAGLSDWAVCYQSRVGPLKWIGPSTHDEIVRAGRDGAALVVCPLAFVSEHSETLVELDIEYRGLAEKAGVPHYRRAPTVGTHAAFIGGLADTARRALRDETSVCSAGTHDVCPASHARCPRRTASL
jgi:ferrochelatase